MLGWFGYWRLAFLMFYSLFSINCFLRFCLSFLFTSCLAEEIEREEKDLKVLSRLDRKKESKKRRKERMERDWALSILSLFLILSDASKYGLTYSHNTLFLYSFHQLTFEQHHNLFTLSFFFNYFNLFLSFIMAFAKYNVNSFFLFK